MERESRRLGQWSFSGRLGYLGDEATWMRPGGVVSGVGALMKGLILVGFVEWVEERHGADAADELVESTVLESQGAFTSVGVYPYTELVALAENLAAREGRSASEVLLQYSRESVASVAYGHDHLLEGLTSALDVFDQVEGHIHREVMALYPDAVLPRIATQRMADGAMQLDYRSHEPLAVMCEGRILGTIDLFGGGFDVTRLSEDPAGYTASFLIAPTSGAPS